MFKENQILNNDEIKAFCEWANNSEDGKGFYLDELTVKRVDIEAIVKQTEIKNEIYELEQWFIEYDKQIQQYLRSIRLGKPFDKDISKLDEDALYNALRLKQLRAQL